MSFKYAALISYTGTHFCGWQKQREEVSGLLPSIQETFENAVFKMTGERVSIVGSGRTDAGVHATGQVLHFRLQNKEWEPEILKRGLNSLLMQPQIILSEEELALNPASKQPGLIRIQVAAVKAVAPEFHAQRSATQKQYSYYFQQGPCPLPFLEPYSWWIRKKLDISAMQSALNHLIGEHDFKVFQASGSKPDMSTVRTILEAQVEWIPPQWSFPGVTPVVQSLTDQQSEWGLVRVRLLGTGFLKQMVRSINGTLLQVGEGYRKPESFAELLVSRDRKQVGPTAPARALWLERVWYPEIMW